MKRVQSAGELLSEYFSLSNKVIIDVGCGTGDLIRWMTPQGALVVGIDTVPMLEKATKTTPRGSEKFLAGCGEALPFQDNSADLITYIASFHHVLQDGELQALEECSRVLKTKCHAFFVEPIARPDAYYQITRLIEDEAEIQAKAYQAILAAGPIGLEVKSEEIFYFERSFADYDGLLEIFVEDDARRTEVRAQAREVTERLCSEAQIPFDDYRFRSICRALLLEKKGA